MSGSGWMALRQASAYAGCSESTLLRAVRGGRLRASKLDPTKRKSPWRFRAADIDRWLEGNCVSTPVFTRSRRTA